VATARLADDTARVPTTAEPASTAWLFVTFGALLLASVLLARPSGRFGLPVLVVFLAIGMLAGSDGLLGIPFEDYRLSFRLGSAALVLILFHGGFSTPLAAARSALGPSLVLATVGVALTTAIVGGIAMLLGLPPREALLVGAVVSSTDAAAVFSVLRGAGLHLPRRVALTLEVESGLNDPVAVILTMTLTEAMLGHSRFGVAQVLELPLELAVGTLFGVAIGVAARWVLDRARLPSAGLYPAITVGAAFVAFGVPTMFHGSGFLSVYVAGLVLGHGEVPSRGAIARVHDAIAWLSQIAMFLMLGLLVFPSRLIHVAAPGLVLGLALAFVARPLAVALCLAPFRFPVRELALVSWIGLRGAVPIILATFPVFSGAERGGDLFDLVFFIVVVNSIVVGTTAGPVARALGMAVAGKHPSHAVLEIHSLRTLRNVISSWRVDESSGARGKALRDLPFPDDSSVMLVVRGDRLLAPRGSTILEAGDEVHVFSPPAAVDELSRWLGDENH